MKTSNIVEPESHFTKCDCHSHVLEIERYEYDKFDKGFNITCWHYGHDGNIRGFKERLRWCWHILKTGKPWADSIIVTDEKAKEIANFITSKLK